ncbi:FAD-binding oxidoreductase (plasmid) [Leisingera sp. M527]|uniref:NAD(P)/FAD-dependent oxidoreductase n=1 Tax=Leisingera sp. M527 TaxID=2867014 RepID=UPI0021A89738|nr:FAD-binding oxidoreductase [Leisingera sp. M527]UWQ35336.1 FAD-binding oxidoreductase [Leisingera sp. M527]
MDSVLVNPAALARGLAQTLPGETVTVFENTPVLRADFGQQVTLNTVSGRVIADNIILATNVFTSSFGFLKSRLLPFFLTASLTRPLSDDEFSLIGRAKDWGLISGHRMGATVRLTDDRRIFIRNTADCRFTPHQKAGELDHFRRIHEDGIARRFPMLPGLKIEHTWGGFVCMTRNRTTAFGQLSRNVFTSTAYNGSGVSKASLFGKLLADKIAGAGSSELTAAEEMAPPKWMPPRPILDLGVQAAVLSTRRHLGKDG